MTYIVDVKYALPRSKAVVLQDYVHLGISKLQARIFHDFHGLESIPVSDDESIEDLINMSVSNIIDANKIDRNEVDYIIYARTSLTNTPFAYGILNRIKLKHHIYKAKCFSINLNKCASAIETLSIIDKIFKADPNAKLILMITGDIAFTKQQRTLQSASIAGDAAAAIIFSRTPTRSPQLKLIQLNKHVYPEFYKGPWINKEQAMAFEERFPNMMGTLIRNTIEKCGLLDKQIKYILPHNVNIPIWKKIADEANLPFEKMYIQNIAKHGHCFTSDFLINCSYIKDHLKADDYILAANVGFGLTFYSAIFQQIEGDNE